MDKKLPVASISAALLASDVLGNHQSLHIRAHGPVFPISAWGQQTLINGTSTSVAVTGSNKV